MTLRQRSEKSQYQNVHTTSLRHNSAGEPTITSGPYSSTTYDRISESRGGESVKNYAYRISNGLDATGAYSLDATLTEQSEGRWYAEWSSNSNRKYRDYDETTGNLNPFTFAAFPSMGSLPAEAQSAASGQYWSDISSKQSFGLTFLGELRETVGMLRHPLKGLRQLTSEYLSGLRKNADRIRRKEKASKRKYLADAYLEYAFGWIPLIQDVNDIVEASILHLNDVEYVPVSGFASRDQATVAAPQTMNVANYGRLLRYQRTTQRSFVKCKGALRLKREVDGPMVHFADSFGVGVMGFVPTVWELLPYSFLVDYFSNVGDMLSYAFACNASIAWSCNTAVTREETLVSYSGPVKNPSLESAPLNGYQTGSMGSHRRVRYRMGRGKGVPPPSWSVSLPSWGQGINISALIAQGRSTSRLL